MYYWFDDAWYRYVENEQKIEIFRLESSDSEVTVQIMKILDKCWAKVCVGCDRGDRNVRAEHGKEDWAVCEAKVQNERNQCGKAARMDHFCRKCDSWWCDGHLWLKLTFESKNPKKEWFETYYWFDGAWYWYCYFKTDQQPASFKLASSHSDFTAQSIKILDNCWEDLRAGENRCW